MCGCVEDGIIPGLFGYEAGQSCVGDHFCVVRRAGPAEPPIARRPARAASTSTPSSRSGPPRLRVGESGLLALDWWNGNRSVLVDAALSGLLVGTTLATTPEEIYRALIEATAYGTRVIIETFEANGVPIHDVVACGRAGREEPADHADLRRRDRAARSASARRTRRRPSGAAMFGAVAAGAGRRRSRHDRGRRRCDGPAQGRGVRARPDGSRRSTTSCTASTCGSTTTSVAARTTS